MKTSIKELINYHNEDLKLWQSDWANNDFTWYHISIEGYIGFQSVRCIVNLYEKFLKEISQFIVLNNYEKTNKYDWNCFYQTRVIQICYEHDAYWCFTDTYKSTQIWDLYYWLEDVIHQLKEVDEQTKMER